MTNTIGIFSGDYIKCSDKTDLERCEYIDEIVQNIRLVLTAKRGRFYPNKNFGSLLSKICDEPKNEYAAEFAAQALEQINGVFVKSASIKDNALFLNLTINGKERQVILKIENNL